MTKPRYSVEFVQQDVAFEPLPTDEVFDLIIRPFLRRVEAEIAEAMGLTSQDLARRTFLVSDPDRPGRFYAVTTDFN